MTQNDNVQKVGVNRKIWTYFKKREDEDKNTFVLCGGRRSGKTYAICQYLLRKIFNNGMIVNMAAMTSEQGRLGAYSDCKTIIASIPLYSQYLEVFSSPREIRCRHNGGRMFFNSYQNAETAKGVACDYLFINEANNFSKQQYTDLMANVRCGVFIDYNPNIEFWVDDLFEPEDILVTTWKDNIKHLTPLQLEYFENLKKQAERPNATAVDIRNYNVYYLGQYSELRGTIFLEEDLHFIDEVPDGLRNFCIFCDPSALCGSDYFACVLSARDADRNVYILDVFSINSGTREQITYHLKEWMMRYDRVRLFIETNGIIGQEFFEYARKSGLRPEAWYSKNNKFERILANYDNIRNRTFFVKVPLLKDYMSQVYDFDTKCEHDDNIDAINSAYNLQAFQ